MTESDAVATEGAMIRERQKKPWSRPAIRHIGETIYTETGTKQNPVYFENLNYMPVGSS